jgi:hypothetical protein
MADCYICMEECYTLSPCKCVNMYLHEDCYAKLLAYDNDSCKICNEPYPDKPSDIFIDLEDDESEEDDENNCSFSAWYITPMMCRPLHFDSHSVFYCYDLMFEPVRYAINIWVITCVLKQMRTRTNTTGLFVDVFHSTYLGEWLFAIVFHAVIAVIVRSAATDKHRR